MIPFDIHPADCPAFDYSTHPDCRRLLPRRVGQLLIALRTRRFDTLDAAADTRGVHRELFWALTPHGHPYFAGHYRGEDFRCLRNYRVQVGPPIDTRVGCPPLLVLGAMGRVEDTIRSAIAALDAAHQLPNSVVLPGPKLLHTVQVACRIFEWVNRIHPYANGNGHAARFCVWAILGRYGYWPVRWPLDPRPPDPPYTSLLLEYRAGNPERLEQYILQCLVN
jgi:fido (protein-threonine AMPylation protein)